MIRPFTCICMVVFAGSGLYLYQAKHIAELETREIHRLRTEAETTRQRAAVLVTEYQLENDPQRLGDLAARFEPQLKQTQPTQFTTFADLERRLPPIGLPAPATQAPPSDDLVYNYPPTPRALLADVNHDDTIDTARAASNATFKVAGAGDASPAHPAAKQAPRTVTAARETTKAFVPPGDSSYSNPSQIYPARPAPSFAPASYSTPVFANADQGSMLGSSMRRPSAQPRAFTPSFSPVAASQRPYYAPQYAPIPLQMGGSALGMARPMAAPAYQGPQYQTGNIGNGG